MYMGFFGIIDVVVIVLALLFMFIGYKRGFMNKMITIICVLVIIGLSVALCGHMAEMMRDNHIFYDGIYKDVNAKVGNAIEEAGTNATVKQVVAKALHLPEWIASLFVLSAQNEIAINYQAAISEKISMLLMKTIAFGFLFVGMIIVMIILKIIANALRENKFVRVVDGIFGMALYLLIYILIVSVFFFVLNILVEKEVISSTTGFIAKDLQLMDTSKFSMSRWLLKGNLISSIREVFIK